MQNPGYTSHSQSHIHWHKKETRIFLHFQTYKSSEMPNKKVHTEHNRKKLWEVNLMKDTYTFIYTYKHIYVHTHTLSKDIIDEIK